MKEIDNLAKVLAGLEELHKSSVLVGIPEKTTERDDDDASKEPTNAQIGYWMEFGVPSQNIPARPWLTPGVKAGAPQSIKRLKNASNAALDGDPRRMRNQLKSAGIESSSAVKNKMNSGIPPALAKSTLAERKRRGVSRTKPLIDTGKLRNSISFVVK